MPPSGDAVPAKQVLITSWPRPSTSKICAPQYELSVEMPIFDRILSRPFSAAERNCARASAGVGRGAVSASRSRRDSSRVLAEEPVDGLERQPRVHRLGAVADERGEVVDVERVARLGDEADARAESGVHQVLAHGADGEQHGDRRVGPVRGAVADDEDVGARGAPPARRRGGAR